MGESEPDSDRNDRYRLLEDTVLLNGDVDDALYQAIRYERFGYDHLRGRLLDEIEGVRDLADEILEREEYSGSSGDTIVVLCPSCGARNDADAVSHQRCCHDCRDPIPIKRTDR